MSESSKRNRQPVQKFVAWAEGDKHTPQAIRNKKKREQAKGREKREQLKQKKMGQAEEDKLEMDQSLVDDSLVQENLVKEVADSTVSTRESSDSQPD